MTTKTKTPTPTTLADAVAKKATLAKSGTILLPGDGMPLSTLKMAVHKGGEVLARNWNSHDGRYVWRIVKVEDVRLATAKGARYHDHSLIIKLGRGYERRERYPVNALVTELSNWCPVGIAPQGLLDEVYARRAEEQAEAEAEAKRQEEARKALEAQVATLEAQLKADGTDRWVLVETAVKEPTDRGLLYPDRKEAHVTLRYERQVVRRGREGAYIDTEFGEMTARLEYRPEYGWTTHLYLSREFTTDIAASGMRSLARLIEEVTK